MACIGTRQATAGVAAHRTVITNIAKAPVLVTCIVYRLRNCTASLPTLQGAVIQITGPCEPTQRVPSVRYWAESPPSEFEFRVSGFRQTGRNSDEIGSTIRLLGAKPMRAQIWKDCPRRSGTAGCQCNCSPSWENLQKAPPNRPRAWFATQRIKRAILRCKWPSRLRRQPPSNGDEQFLGE